MISLLPPPYKEKLREEQYFRLASILGLLALLFFVCVSLLFLAIRIYVSGELRAQEILIATRQQEVEEEQSPVVQIREINWDITRLATFYKERNVLSEILQQVTEAMPEGAYLTSFEYSSVAQSGNEQGRGRISLAGFAPITEDILILKAALEEEPAFSNFFFPQSNWANPTATNINFSFTFEVQLL